MKKGGEVEILAQIRAYFPAGTPLETRLVGYHFLTRLSGPSDYTLTYQYAYEKKFVLVRIMWRESPDGARQLYSLNANELTESLQKANAFTFERAGVQHYLFLVCTITVPLFIIVTLVACVRTKMRRGKWIWIFFILFGIGQLSINWSTGEMFVKTFNFQLLGSGTLRASAYSPWFLMFSMPVGAILFWILRNRLRAEPAPADPPVAPVVASDERPPTFPA